MTPIITVGINTRVVEELLNSLIDIVINIGTHIAIVNASITSKTAQVPEENIWSKTVKSLGSVVEVVTFGNPASTIRILIALMSKNGVKAHNIILNLYEPSR